MSPMQSTVDTFCSEICINLDFSYLNEPWEVDWEPIQVQGMGGKGELGMAILGTRVH